MASDPAIVVVAYQRPGPLYRLLGSLLNAVYEHGRPALVISIDGEGSPEVEAIAADFEWPHGDKIIIRHKDHLGLKAHVLSCGALSAEYGSVIVLEDDLVVSPYFYSYAQQARDFYRNDTRIAGISLYNYEVSESSFYAFRAMDDGSDVYFMQVASSWGQLWTHEQWQGFAGWLKEHSTLPQGNQVPPYLQHWGTHSWKKHFIHYLAATQNYFAFPRLSLSSNFGEPGTNAAHTNVFQVPLQSAPRSYRFNRLEDSGAVYDAWFEISPQSLNKLNPQLGGYNYAVDLYGTKDVRPEQTEFVLTAGRGEKPVKTFGGELFPPEQNIALNLAGSKIGLYRTGDAVVRHSLSVRNVMQELSPAQEPGISVVLVVSGRDVEGIVKTAASFAEQQVRYKELIVVCAEESREWAGKALSYHTLTVKWVQAQNGTKPASLFYEGAAHARYEIVTLAYCGTLYAKTAFQRIISIFTTFQSVCWVRGVDEICRTAGEYSKVRTLRYRLIAAEALRQLERGALDASPELHFLRRQCLKSQEPDTGSLAGLFFSLITRYQMHVAVDRFGQRSPGKEPENAGPGQKEVLLKRYGPLKNKVRLSSRLVNLLIKLPWFNDGAWQWYLPSLQNVPDILRFDPKNRTFYFNRF